MNPDYSINDAWNAGFEAGVAYTFGHIEQDKFNERELTRFIHWLELKNPWKTFDEWKSLIYERFIRMTEDDYNKYKTTYVEFQEKFKDDPTWLSYYIEAEKHLDAEWQQIQKTGMYR